MVQSSSVPVALAAFGLVKTYGSGETEVSALRGVDLEIATGGITAIMGKSGSGKSTLLQVLAGLDAPTSGRVVLGDVELSGLGDDALTRLRRSRMGFVFQAFNLLPALDVAENIRLPFLLAGTRPDTETERWIDQLIDRLGLGPRRGHRPAELSGGQQQRVAIARALATRPDVVFADEPTGSLDSASAADVLDLFAAIVRDAGQTVVLVTHDAEAAARADRIVRLADGVVVGDESRAVEPQVRAGADR